MNKSQIYDSIIKNMPVGFSMVDREGKILEFNHAAEMITGYARNEVIGKSHVEILHGSPESDYCPLFKRVLNKRRKTISAETVIKKKDGEYITSAVTAFPVYNEQGELAGGIELFQDITVQKRIERERRNFLSMFVHDMKNPVLASKGFLSRILSSRAGPLTKKQREYSEIISESLNKLEMLIKDFLEFAKFESKKYRPKFKPLHLENIVHENIGMLKVEAEKKNIQIEFKNEKDLPQVRADEMMINRVIANLLSNALKYTEPGKRIILRGIEKENSLLFQVINPGVSIPKEHLPYIFDAFHRVTEDAQGSGLGLAISEKIIDLHKGRIWAEISPEKETVFGFILPKA